ncbi:MAG: metallophosphoesterase family protein [Desulfitobacteriaceae bacterium]
MSSSVRFLHCAGFRFDSPSWEGPSVWAAMRNQDLWQTFEAVLSLCRSEKVDFLFLTGDLFEQEYVRKETVERVARSFAKLDGTRIFIAPGERDPIVITSVYRLAVWPSNVHIFIGGISRVEIPLRKVTVYGAGWTTYRQEGAFLDGFQTTRDGTLQFMLLHAEVDSVQNTEGFIPIMPEQIASSGLTYLALGHQEAWGGIQQAEETFWADCGSSEARSFRESGPHGVILGEFEKESARFEFRELGQRRYIEKALSTQADMKDLAAKLLADTSVQERQKDLFRIKLSGSFRDVETSVQTLQKLLADKFRYVEVLPCEGQPAQFGSDVVATVDSIVGNEQKSGYSRKETAVPDFQDGYPTLTQVFVDRIHERLVAAESTEKFEYWKLVQKIGLAALGQGREDDED